MSNEDKLFELMTKLYSEMQEGFKHTNERIDSMEGELKSVKGEVQSVKDDVQSVRDDVKKIKITIEHDLKPKIEALFDGYKQNTEKLERIEEEVSKHEEIILRRIR